ncbi:MerC domain-containing protein [Shewanella electrodiphila]|uniref:MerC domain-containing protein n=1 Tax=Shewanella electrodiphila TaxID=934143 RepID=A0ABT0KNZ2_9GAMM|nr:MerC domain-containing protein [Shewanella electrodiphila]MCL1045565.1 MerC domain-containing protein [Shewanella electrodiphila]
MTNNMQSLLDKLAIGLSSLCALHCIATPILLALLPSLSALPLNDHLYHEVMVWLVLPTSTIAVLMGCQRHRDAKVLMFAIVGLLTLVASSVYGHDIVGEVGEKLLTLAGAFIVAYAHWRNVKLCRKQVCCKK